jgi:hypothetical protein
LSKSSNPLPPSSALVDAETDAVEAPAFAGWPCFVIL